MKDAFYELVKEIVEYESDTFSASSSEITTEEADKVAHELVANWKMNYLDGVQIDTFLDKIRGNENV